MLPSFKGITKDIISTPVNCKLGNLEVNANPPDQDSYDVSSQETEAVSESTDKEGEEPPEISGNWDDRLNSFQKLIMVKCFREEKVCDNKVAKVDHLSLLFIATCCLGCVCSV